jgi:hypothetical protein
MPDIPVRFGQRKPVSRKGGSAGLRDHTRGYRRLCASLLDQHPLCAYCKHAGLIVPATLCDHIICLALNGSNDRSNLTSSCARCNSEKAKAEAAFIRRGYDMRDIMNDPDLSSWIRIGQKKY